MNRAGSPPEGSRAARGLSQRALAARAGNSGATVAAYETGTKDPRTSTWLRLLAAAGYEVDVVLDVFSS